MHSLCYISLGQTGFSYPLGIFKCHPVYFRVYFLQHSLNFMFMAESRETQIVSAGGKKLPPSLQLQPLALYKSVPQTRYTPKIKGLGRESVLKTLKLSLSPQQPFGYIKYWAELPPPTSPHLCWGLWQRTCPSCY